ncbi:MAG: Asp23/Gls24 family envelope stress response protein [Peptococcaceae bacterium]|nr:Asp23/Gls24 family envelope stress response protein [Peptococcaceae bacterium]
MDKAMEEALGNVRIADEVVEVISGMAASQIEGVVSLGNGGAVSDIANIFTRGSRKGIKVEIHESEAKIDLYLTVKFGSTIPKIAGLVQEAVKENVENMTGLTVAEINIHIQGVAFKDDVIVAEQDDDEE